MLSTFFASFPLFPLPVGEPLAGRVAELNLMGRMGGMGRMVSGEFGGQLHFFPNLGNALNPVFSKATGAFNPFDGIDVGLVSRPAFTDLDGGGDQDLICGSLSGDLRFFRNTGNLSR